MFVTSLLAAALAVTLQIPAQVGVLTGEVRSEETGTTVTGASVEVVGSMPARATATNADGEYRLTGVRAGRQTIRARMVGYAPLEMDVVVPAGGRLEVDITLRMMPIALKPVSVRTRPHTIGGDTTAAASGELAMAGVRAMQSSPGIAELGLAEAASRDPGHEPHDPSDVLFVRGTGTDLKMVYLDGAPVYAPFPLGGLIDPFSPELLSSAEVYLGGAPARFDGGLSYILDLRTRGARLDRVHSSGAVDMLSARGIVEVPVTQHAALLFSGRGVHGTGTDWTASDGLPYGYREGLARADLSLGSFGSLSVTAFGNGEQVWVDSARSRSRAVHWGNQAGSLRYQVDLGETALEVTAAAGDFDARLPVEAPDNRIAEGTSRRRRLAADAVSRMGDFTLRYGASAEKQWQQYRTHSSGWQEGGWQPVGQVAEGQEAGVYVDAGVWIGSRLRLRGGLRADHFSLGDEIAFAPRLAATLMLTDRATVTLAGGRYHQYLRLPEAEFFAAAELSPLLMPEPLALARATHVALSVDQHVGEGIRFGLEGFYKNYEGVPGGTSADANASGVDLWLRRNTGDWQGWLGYSLSWTWSEARPATASRFSGRHLISSGLSAPLGGPARLDLGFVYGAGLPYSAIPFSAPPEIMDSPMRDALSEFYVGDGASPVRAGSAPLLATPNRPYLRVDVGASGTWSPRLGQSAMEITPYIRLLNTLGERDALFYRMGAEDGSFDPVMALPLVPVVGLQWKF